VGGKAQSNPWRGSLRPGVFAAPVSAAAAAVLESAATVVPAAVFSAALVAAFAGAHVLAVAVVLAASVVLDVPRGRALVLARLGDSGKHGDGAAKRETGNEDSNQLGHGVLHSHGQTGEGGGPVSPHRVTFA
jgi:hypothetical protein